MSQLRCPFAQLLCRERYTIVRLMLIPGDYVIYLRQQRVFFEKLCKVTKKM